jgi:cellulose synthase/poly-beta-1,6-N-acetylglucosamine synthase-like glycosyltransferase
MYVEDEAKPNELHPDAVTISFVIPALNEERNIGRTLSSITSAAERKFAFEIILCDNGSSDRTRDIARDSGATVYDCTHRSIGAMRNFGASRARGEVLVFLDADVSLTKQWGNCIVGTLAELERSPDVIMGSQCLPPDSRGLLNRYWFASFGNGALTHLGSGHMVMRKSLFERLGGFAEHLRTGEDYDLCKRVERIGGKVVENPALEVIHDGFPENLREFVRRECWHGAGDLTSLAFAVRSKVVLAGLLHLGLQVAAVSSLAVGRAGLAGAMLGALVVFLLVTSLAKFRGRPASHIVVNAYVLYWYFWGRNLALIWRIGAATRSKLQYLIRYSRSAALSRRL